MSSDTQRKHMRRHDAMVTSDELGNSPSIDWSSFGVSDWQKPMPYEPAPPEGGWQGDGPLPAADVVVMTWNRSENTQMRRGTSIFEKGRAK